MWGLTIPTAFESGCQAPPAPVLCSGRHREHEQPDSGGWMDILAERPLIPASFLLLSMSLIHPPAHGRFLLPFFYSYTPVRTGPLAMIRPISPFTYSWILVFSGLAAYLPDISDA